MDTQGGTAGSPVPELQSEAGSCDGSSLMSTSSYCGTVVADVTRPGDDITERLQLSEEDVSSLRTRPYSCSSEEEVNRPWTPGLPVPRRDHCGIDATLAGDGLQPLGHRNRPTPPPTPASVREERDATLTGTSPVSSGTCGSSSP